MIENKVKLKVYSEQGTFNKERKLLCQDRFFSFGSEELQVIAIGDGKGSSVYSGISAEVSSMVISKHVKENFKNLMKQNPNKIRKEISILIEPRLRSLGTVIGLPNPKEQLASTLMVCAVENDGKAIAFHMGDGYIMKTDGKKLMIVSGPEICIVPQCPYLLMANDLQKHLRVCKFNLSIGEYLIVMTDGAFSKYVKNTKKGYVIRKSLQSIIYNKKIKQGTDDACYSVLWIETTNPITN